MSEVQAVSEIEMRPLNTIKPYIRNPRENDQTTDLLVEIIPKVGFNVPIVIDENGVIVKGHSRFKAAIRLGMKEVPCVVTHADDEAIKLDRIADNRVSEFSEWLDEGLMHELDMLNIDFDLTLLDFEMPDFEDFDDYGEGDSEAAAERLERFKKMQEESTPVSFVSEKQIAREERKQATIGKVEKKYYKVVCEKCGHISYVAEGDVVALNEGE